MPTPVFGGARTVTTFNGDEVGGLSELETGDVNGDGVPDVVVTRLAYPPAHKTFPVGILLGDGRGGFTDGSTIWDGPPARTEHGRQILLAAPQHHHRRPRPDRARGASPARGSSPT
jgi:FG-GAP repeat